MRVESVGAQFDRGAHAGAEHHQAHDGTGRDNLAVAHYIDIGGKTFGGGDQLGRRAGVQAPPVNDPHGHAYDGFAAHIAACSGPAWAGSGKELFYENLTDDVFVCTVEPKGAEIEVGTPQRLFHAASPGIGTSFDVSSDGQRLLVNHSEEETQAPLQLVTNWLAELKK